MSLSNPRAASPVKRYFRIRSSTGDVVYYDKEARKEVVVETPFKFIVLDVLNIIGGFNDDEKSGIWSNEVRTNDDELTVRTKKGVLAKGSYNAIKDRVKADGGKFGNSVYIAYQEDGEMTLGNLQLLGAAVSEWFDFKKGVYLDRDPGVQIASWEHRTKGRNEFEVPVFKSMDVSPESMKAATELDEALQAYLRAAPAARDDRDDEPRREPIRDEAPSFSGGYDDAEPPF